MTVDNLLVEEQTVYFLYKKWPSKAGENQLRRILFKIWV